MLIGKTAIIDADIVHQLGASATAYELTFHRVNLHSEPAILDALEEYNDDETDLVVISRGGGDGVDVFNSCTLAEACLNLTPPLVTAIGHKDDVTLVQRIADRAFITPTALGEFLASIHEEVVEASVNSRAVLVDSITKQLTAQHNEQLKTLAEKITTAEALHIEHTALLAAQLADREASLLAQRESVLELRSKLDAVTAEKPLWFYVLIAALAGVILGALLVVLLK
jgi:exonuclease VII large subunit